MRGVDGSALVALALSFACQSGKLPGERERPSEHAAAAPVPSGQRPVFVRGPTNGTPIAPYVAQALSEGQRGHFNVLVYVGATWCEPCQRFHQAVLAGEFDSILPGAHLVEFDLDADRDALGAAGYSSKLIPLFCVPKADGTASDRRLEGSIKGAEAVRQNLLPRMRSFLAGENTG